MPKDPPKARMDYGPDVSSFPKAREDMSGSDYEAYASSAKEVLSGIEEKAAIINEVLDNWIAAGELTVEQAEIIKNNFTETARQATIISDRILGMLDKMMSSEEAKAALSEEQIQNIQSSLSDARGTISNQTQTIPSGLQKVGGQIQEGESQVKDHLKKAGAVIGDGVGRLMKILTGAGKMSLVGAVWGVVEKMIEITQKMDQLAGKIQTSQMMTMSTGGVAGLDESRKMGSYLTGLEMGSAGAITPEDFMKTAGQIMSRGISTNLEEIKGAPIVRGGSVGERNQQLGLFRSTYALSGMLHTSQDDILASMEMLKNLGMSAGQSQQELVGLYNTAQDLGVSFQELKGWSFEAAKQLMPLGYNFEQTTALVGHFAGELQEGVMSISDIIGGFTSFFQKQNIGAQAAIGYNIMGMEAETAAQRAVQGQLAGATDAFAMGTRVRAIGEQGSAAEKAVVYQEVRAQAEQFARSQGYEEGTPEFIAAMDTVGETYGVSGQKLLEGSEAFWDAVEKMDSPAELMESASRGMNEAAAKLDFDLNDFFNKQMQSLKNAETIQEKIHRISEWGFIHLWMGIQRLLSRWDMGVFAGEGGEKLAEDMAVELAEGLMSGIGMQTNLDWADRFMLDVAQQSVINSATDRKLIDTQFGDEIGEILQTWEIGGAAGQAAADINTIQAIGNLEEVFDTIMEQLSKGGQAFTDSQKAAILLDQLVDYLSQYEKDTQQIQYIVNTVLEAKGTDTEIDVGMVETFMETDVLPSGY